MKLGINIFSFLFLLSALISPLGAFSFKEKSSIKEKASYKNSIKTGDIKTKRGVELTQGITHSNKYEICDKELVEGIRYYKKHLSRVREEAEYTKNEKLNNEVLVKHCNLYKQYKDKINKEHHYLAKKYGSKSPGLIHDIKYLQYLFNKCENNS